MDLENSRFLTQTKETLYFYYDDGKSYAIILKKNYGLFTNNQWFMCLWIIVIN